MDSKEMAPGDIERRSFEIITEELGGRTFPPLEEPVVKRVIHTTADFDMENILYTDNDAVETLHAALHDGKTRTIVTDGTMTAAGGRKGARERLGIEVKCYLDDPRVVEMASRLKITRTQAGIRLAVEEHPGALYVFGNAPTALLEQCDRMRQGLAHPVGVICAPVGFVNVLESKHMLKSFTRLPKLVIEGR